MAQAPPKTRNLGRLTEIRDSRVVADVAIVWDTESFWAQDLEWRPSNELNHRERIEAFYTALWTQGVTVDFVHPSHELGGYRLVVVPSLYLISPESVANLRQYVANGGALLVSYFSGVVDQNDAVYPGAAYTDSWVGSGVDPRRIMEADDIAKMIYSASKLSPQACVEEIILRPQLGDL